MALVGRADVGVLGNYIIEAIKRSFPEKFYLKRGIESKKICENFQVSYRIFCCLYRFKLRFYIRHSPQFELLKSILRVLWVSQALK